MKYNVMLCKLFVLTLLSFNVFAQSNIKTIPFGKNNVIRYDLSTGLYDVVYGGMTDVSKAFAEGHSLASFNSKDFSKRTFSSIAINDKFGKGTCNTITLSGSNNVQMQQLFFTYPGKDYFFTQLIVTGAEGGCNYLSVLNSGAVQMEKEADSRAVFIPFDNDAWMRYHSSNLDKSNFTSSEVGIVYSNKNEHGFIAGSLDQDDWKSGITIKGQSESTLSMNVFAGFTDSLVTRDHKAHGFVGVNQKSCASPKFLIGSFANWKDGMETYAKSVRIQSPRYIFNWNKAKPMGWNSWGVLQEKINKENTSAVIDFFADSCKGFRNADNTLYIDLDSFWDNMTSGGIGGDISTLKAFADHCRAKGLRPGVYWAPFTDWGKNAEGKVEGSDYKYKDCWLTVNGQYHDFDGGRAMDPTHPATLAKIAFYMKRFKECGFEMIKIDFLGHAAIEADHYYDNNVHTGMQAYKKGMQYLNDQMAGTMLVYAAISANIATSKYVHMRRIACDAFKQINETAYTLNSTGLGWWQNELYDFVDADHVVFGNESEGVNRARLASSLITGTLITGDDYSKEGQWKERARKLLQNKDIITLAQQKNNFRPVEIEVGDKAPNIFASVGKQYTYIAVLNYDESEKPFVVDLTKLGLKNTNHASKELYSGAVKNVGSALQVSLSGKDAVIYKIRN